MSYYHPRCRRCGNVGDRTFAEDANGEMTDVLAPGLRVEDLTCCDVRDCELMPEDDIAMSDKQA